MPTSCAGNRRYVTVSLQQKCPERILDLGCGVGEYARMIRRYLPDRVKLYGLDAYMPYLAQRECEKYDALIRGDIFDVVEGRIIIPVDCVLAMDVIEHFERDKAKRLSDWLLAQPLAYMSTPLFWFEQDPSNGNELERHRSGFSFEEIMSWGWIPLAKVRWDERGWVGSFKSRE